MRERVLCVVSQQRWQTATRFWPALVLFGGRTLVPNSVVRIIQRYLIPRLAVSAYYLFRDRCYISPKAHVQLSRRIRFGRGTVVKPFAVIQTQTGMIRLVGLAPSAVSITSPQERRTGDERS
jgi:hypothetical protein